MRRRKRGTQRLVVSLSTTTLDRPFSIPPPPLPPPIQPLASLYPPHGEPANWGQKSIWTCSHFSLICRLLARNRTELRRTRTGLVGGGLFPSWAGATRASGGTRALPSFLFTPLPPPPPPTFSRLSKLVPTRHRLRNARNFRYESPA